MKHKPDDKLWHEFSKSAVFTGWNASSLQESVSRAGWSEFDLHRKLPDALDNMALYYVEIINAEHEEALNKAQLASMKMGERIKYILRSRIEIIAKNKALAQSFSAYLSNPMHSGLAIKCLYESVDFMWRIAGDKSLDFNFYTKRGTLAIIYSKIILYYFSDDSENHAKTDDFINKQVNMVLKFGKFKQSVHQLFTKQAI